MRERAEAVVVVAGGGREAYVRRLAVLFPSRTIKELLEHDEWCLPSLPFPRTIPRLHRALQSPPAPLTRERKDTWVSQTAEGSLLLAVEVLAFV